MSLRGLRVLVTRPAHQAEPLCAAIEAAGGHALRQPLLSIRGLHDSAGAMKRLTEAQDASAVIFTSANGVEWAQRLLPGWHPAGEVLAVGRSTALALEQWLGREVHTPASDFSSEGLLELPALSQPEGRKLAIVSGSGGRQYLAQTLRERGAQVDKIAVYRREQIPVSAARLKALYAEADAVFVSSGQTLEHLHAITPANLKANLQTLQLVVPSARVVKLALKLGFSRPPLHPARMQDDAIVAALLAWVARAKDTPVQLGYFGD